MPAHDILTAITSLAAVIAVILLVRYGTRLAGALPRRGAAQGRLAVEASLAVDPRRRLTLVRCDGHQVLLLTGGPSDVLLGWLPQGAAQAGWTASLPADNRR